MKIFKNSCPVFKIAVLVFVLAFTQVMRSQSGGRCKGAMAEQMIFDSSGGTISRTIQVLPSGCSGGTLAIVSKPSWMPTEPIIDGTNIQATLPAFFGNERTGSIILTIDGNTAGSITVMQNRSSNPEPTCSISGFSGGSNFNGQGEERVYNLTYSSGCPSNVKFIFKEIKKGEEVELPGWVQVTQNTSTKTVKVKFSPNGEDKDRTHIIIGKPQDGGNHAIFASFSQNCIKTEWYRDTDGDGFRDEGSTLVEDCAKQKTGYTTDIRVDQCRYNPYANPNAAKLGCPPPCTAEIDKFFLEIPRQGGSGSVRVSNFSDGCLLPRTITYRTALEWLTIDVNGNSLDWSAAANIDNGPQSGSISVLVNDEQVNSIFVNQLGPPKPPEPCQASILINNQPSIGPLDFDSEGDTIELKVVFNRPACQEPIILKDPTGQEGIDEWLQASPQDATTGTFTITARKNDTYQTRSGSIWLVSANNSNTAFGVVRATQKSCMQWWYLDTDNDGSGDVYGSVKIQCGDPDDDPNDDPKDSWVNNNNDLCPTVTGTPANHGCPDGQVPENFNTIETTIYDILETQKGASKVYYNAMGKLIQSQSLDLQTNRIWASETFYDSEGRPALQTLNAPTGNTGFKHIADLTLNGEGDPFQLADFEPDPTSANFSLELDNPSKVAENEYSLGWYYSDKNNRETHQDITDRPYSRSIYSKLNPGTVLRAIGGNRPDTNGDGNVDNDDKWPSGHVFSMLASQELAQNVGFGDTKYNAYKITKTVSRDVHGVENVIFTDSDGKALASARSGNGAPSTEQMVLKIGEQGYVDVHVAKGIAGFTVDRPGEVKIYDLITEVEFTEATVNIGNGFYRVAVNDIENYDPKKPIQVSHHVDYYDYSLNEYDHAGRLTTSYQPLGDRLNKKPKTEYKYNTLGQLIYTKSPDEGEAWFEYRRDGQIRFSTNSKQWENKEFSYTNYDPLGRPEESGVYKDASLSYLSAYVPLENGVRTTDPFKEALKTLIDTPDGDGLNDTNCSEIQKTTYDHLVTADETYLASLAGDYNMPSFLGGNVAKTENDNTATYYSYDVYGRVKWVVQDINGLGGKTIDYQYDPITGQVRKVYYQKGLPSERFIHRYDYNIVDQLTSVATSIDDKTFNMRAQYTYYETGALKRTELAGGGVQGIDYVYNLAGQLKAINPSGESSDLFGMQIDYHSSDYRRAVNNIQTATYGKDRYNGTIKGIRWQNKGASDQEAVYAYRYNRNNWLESADFGADGIPEVDTTEPLQLVDVTVATGQSKTYENPNGITISPESHFERGSTVLLRIAGGAPSGPAGEYDVHNIRYDANGNIKRLIRNKNNADDGPAMDDLTYAYTTADPQNGPNQLRKITDPAGKVAGADDIGDQLGDALGANYHYNKIGQLVADWEHVSPEERKTYIENGTLPSSILTFTYNASGLVTQVKKNNVPLVKFFYNDRNHRVKKETYGGTNGDKILSTHYVRDVGGQVMAIYNEPQNGTPKVVEHPVYGSGRIGIYKPGSTPKTLYELTDHLGNVRTVFSVTDTNSGLTNEGYSDYFPFGMPMPGRNMVGDYRYAFQGQEKDGETGKEAFELRLWDSRIGRWLTTDPAGQYTSPYLGMGNNPISRIDPDGGCDQPDSSCGWFKRIFYSKDQIGTWDFWKETGFNGTVLDNVTGYGKAPKNFRFNQHFANYTPLPGATSGVQDMKGGLINGISIGFEFATPIPLNSGFGDPPIYGYGIDFGGFDKGVISGEGTTNFVTYKTAVDPALALGVNFGFLQMVNERKEHLTINRFEGAGFEAGGNLLLGYSKSTDIDLSMMETTNSYHVNSIQIGLGADVGYTEWNTNTKVIFD